MTDAETHLKIHLAKLDLPQDAVDWLCEFWNFIQVMDDAADGDKIDRGELDRAVWASLVKMPTNGFYQAHSAWLVPALAQVVLKWLASDLAERSGEADERSYMWRAGYYDVVCLVVALVHGPSSEMSWKALGMYGETCAEYLKEFGNA